MLAIKTGAVTVTERLHATAQVAFELLRLAWPVGLVREKWIWRCGGRTPSTGFLLIFSLSFGHCDHLIHAFLNLSDLWMHFLYEVMFNLGQAFNSFGLLAQPVQKVILFR